MLEHKSGNISDKAHRAVIFAIAQLSCLCSSCRPANSVKAPKGTRFAFCIFCGGVHISGAASFNCCTKNDGGIFTHHQLFTRAIVIKWPSVQRLLHVCRIVLPPTRPPSLCMFYLPAVSDGQIQGRSYRRYGPCNATEGGQNARGPK